MARDRDDGVERLRNPLRSQFREWLRWSALDSRPELKVRRDILSHLQELMNASLRQGDKSAFMDWSDAAREQLFYTRFNRGERPHFVNHHMVRLYEMHLGADLEHDRSDMALDYMLQVCKFAVATIQDESFDFKLKCKLVAAQTQVINRFLRGAGFQKFTGMQELAAYAQLSREMCVIYQLRANPQSIGPELFGAVLNSNLLPNQISASQILSDQVHERFSWYSWLFSMFEVESSYSVSPVFDIAQWAAIRDVLHPSSGWLEWLPSSFLEELIKNETWPMISRFIPTDKDATEEGWKSRVVKVRRRQEIAEKERINAAPVNRKKLSTVLGLLEKAVRESECFRLTSAYPISVSGIKGGWWSLFRLSSRKEYYIELEGYDPPVGDDDSLVSLAEASIDERFFSTFLQPISEKGEADQDRLQIGSEKANEALAFVVANGVSSDQGWKDFFDRHSELVSGSSFFEVQIGWLPEGLYLIGWKDFKFRISLGQPVSSLTECFEVEDKFAVSYRFSGDQVIFEVLCRVRPSVTPSGSYFIERPM